MLNNIDAYEQLVNGEYLYRNVKHFTPEIYILGKASWILCLRGRLRFYHQKVWFVFSAQQQNKLTSASVRRGPQHTCSTDGLRGWHHLCTSPASIFEHNHKSELLPLFVTVLTVYFALVASSSPSLSQLIIGFGFPWAEQLSRVLPPSFASTYCGGVAVNEGGAAEKARTRIITACR